MIYFLTKYILKILLTPFFRIKTSGLEEVPDKGRVIIASNHKSFLDPVIMGIVLKRRIYFMAKKELFEIPVFGRFIKALGAFSVDRGHSDRKALRKSMKILEDEKMLGIFVEGRRIRREGIGEIKSGVYLISKLSNAPVVISCIKGTRPLFLKRSIFYIPSAITVDFKIIGKTGGEQPKEDFLSRIREELESKWKKKKVN